MNYGFELKSQREKAGLSQWELSKLTGINQSSISRWEDNKRTPSIENCVQLADFYGISVDELIGHEIKKNW
ncbi:MAG: helix-turn-helix transcriptional regulator [Clostridiales bacterium]|nr:helix-turn-helix transcriptional regulator [Clostridiales bacterium]